VLRKRAMAPPTKLQFTLYYLVFIIFHHVKSKKNQISPLNYYIISFGPSNNFGQGPPLAASAALHKTRSDASYTNIKRHRRYGSRVENLEYSERRSLSKNLDSSFLSVDE
jgi:hypothetical protein